MEIIKNGSQPSMKGPGEWFTGDVVIDPLFSKREATKAAGALVTFTPGARTAWHTHPAGQTLIITFGLGWGKRRVKRSKKLVRAISSGLPPMKSTGMGPRPKSP